MEEVKYMGQIKFGFNAFPNLESKRFILREVQEKDYLAIYEIYSDDGTVKYQQMGVMQTMEQAQKSVQAFLRGFENKKFIRWCIATRDQDNVVGLITLHSFNECNSQGEIGFMLNKAYWSQNIMGEVGEEVLKFAFQVMDLNRIEASVHPENIASIKLCEKLGFKQEGMKKEAAYNTRTNEYEDRVILGTTKNNSKYKCFEE